jgi:dTDP-4-amino-4,6-dideoxygalactose transaminase
MSLEKVNDVSAKSPALTDQASASPAPRVPITRLDNGSPELVDELLGSVRRIASTGAFTMGAELEAFEEEFAAYCATRFAVGVSSGTDALALALRALHIGPGDEVIVPTNSFIASAEAVSLVGATPRLVDVDPASHLITAEIVERNLTPKTRAVIAVHLFGSVVDLDPILAITRRSGVALVEDTAQAHGAFYRGKRVGTLGDIGCFSFYPTKNLGAWGDGGAIVTADEELADRVRLFRSHGERPRYVHRVVGSTARLDALQAAILRVKLRRLDGWNDQRRAAGAKLRAALASTAVELPAGAFDGSDHVYHLFVVRSDARDELRAALERRGVASAVHYPLPIHLTGAYANLGYGAGSLPVAERLSERICSLPIFPGITDAEIAQVAEAVAWAAPGYEAALAS